MRSSRRVDANLPGLSMRTEPITCKDAALKGAASAKHTLAWMMRDVILLSSFHLGSTLADSDPRAHAEKRVEAE